MSEIAFICAGRGDTEEQSVGPQLNLGTAAADAAAFQKSCGHLSPPEALKTQQWLVEWSSGAALLQRPFGSFRIVFGKKQATLNNGPYTVRP